MRPVRIITAVAFAAAVAVTGCAAHSTATDPSAVPAAPVAAAPASPAPQPVAPAPKQPSPVAKQPAPVRKPVLADGRYESYIRTVDTRNQRLVVDVVQVFEGHAAIDAAIADGMPGDQAQVLYVWVRNQNPRLRTLPLAGDLRVDLLPGDCIESLNHQLAKLVKDARVMNGSRPAYYFTVTVAGGAVHHIKEHMTGNAC
jgi:hypothetical protein